MTIVEGGSHPNDIRARDLRRMRLVAGGLLALMAVVYVAVSLAPATWTWAGYVKAFAEAGMVGACADWFAVTALFRRPFGLPIPHTGIVPRNKARIGEALGAFIADNFLTVAVLDAKLRQLELARWGGQWLRRPQNARRAAKWIADLAPHILAALPKDVLRDVLSRAALAAAKAVPAAPLAAEVISIVWNDGRSQALLDRGLERLAVYLREHEAAILEQVEEKSYRWLPRWVDKIIAGKLTAGASDLLEEMRDPDHPWRLELAQAIEDFRLRLATDPELRARGEVLKLQFLASPALARHIEALWAELEGRMKSGLSEHSGELTVTAEKALLGLGDWLDADEGAQARLNLWARTLVRSVIAPRRQQIGAFVAQVVASWDTKSIVDKLELQVGKDLQYIRVNGTLVGGLVGLLIFTVARLTGLG